MVSSLLTNESLPIAVVDQGLLDQDRNWLRTRNVQIVCVEPGIPFINKRFGCCYSFFDIDNAPFENIIYLDADLLVLKPLTYIRKVLKRGHVICSLSDPAKTLRSRLRYEPIDKIIRQVGAKAFMNSFRREFGSLSTMHKRYVCSRFNTGVVGIRRSTLQTLKQTLYKYHDYFEKFRFPDQDLFSLLLAEHNIRPVNLPYPYNATRLHCLPEAGAGAGRWRKTYYEGVSVRIEDGALRIEQNRIKGGRRFRNEDIRVLHFNTKEKPWHPEATMREGFKGLWEYYYKM